MSNIFQNKEFPPLIGLRLNDAINIIRDKKYMMRIIQFNNDLMDLSEDVNLNRVNLVIHNCIVVDYNFG